MMTYSENYQTRRAKKIEGQKWFFSTTCRFTLLAVCAIFCVLYVVQLSSASTQGYVMRDLESQIQKLEQDNQKLAYDIANQRSIKKIAERLQTTNLVVADNIKYVTLPGSAVAVR